MKPRIRLIGGIFYCANFDPVTRTWHSPKGMGFTPGDAYAAWKGEVR